MGKPAYSMSFYLPSANCYFFLPFEETPLIGEMSAELTEGCPFSEKKGAEQSEADEVSDLRRIIIDYS